jgi:hypothetical protein
MLTESFFSSTDLSNVCVCEFKIFVFESFIYLTALDQNHV